jgi:hypothetical protein
VLKFALFNMKKKGRRARDEFSAPLGAEEREA